MATLIRLLHTRDIVAARSGGAARYVVNGTPVSSPSVTGLVSRQFEEFDADMALAMISDAKRAGRSDAEILAAWQQTGALAQRLGTTLHETIERRLRDGYLCSHYEVSQEMRQFESFYSTVFVPQNIEVIALEAPVYYESGDFILAGTIDCLAQNTETGELFIIDWKRTTKTKESQTGYQTGIGRHTAELPDTKHMRNSLQLHMYRYILLKQYGVSKLPPGNLWNVLFHADLPDYCLEIATDVSHIVSDIIDDEKQVG